MAKELTEEEKVKVIEKVLKERAESRATTYRLTYVYSYEIEVLAGRTGNQLVNVKWDGKNTINVDAEISLRPSSKKLTDDMLLKVFKIASYIAARTNTVIYVSKSYDYKHVYAVMQPVEIDGTKKKLQDDLNKAVIKALNFAEYFTEYFEDALEGKDLDTILDDIQDTLLRNGGY